MALDYADDARNSEQLQQQVQQNIQQDVATTSDLTKQMSQDINKIVGLLSKMSQTNARNFSEDSRKGKFGEDYDNFRRGGSRSGARKGFLDEFEQQLLDGLIGSDFKKRVSESMENLAKEMGVSVKDIPSEFGKQLGTKLGEAFKESKFGSIITDKTQSFLNDTLTKFNTGVFKFDMKSGTDFSGMMKNMMGGAEGAEAASKAASSLQTLAGSTEGAEAMLAGISEAAPAVIGQLAALAPAAVLVGNALYNLDAATEEFANIINVTGAALIKSANRVYESRKKNLEYEKARIKDDVNTLIEQPFTVLKNAINEIYNAWDSNLRTITATQGYNKSDLQDLMAAFADRIRSEGLTDVVSGTSIMENLTKVLQSGLSGAIAEEFAYQATILSAAVPTQDFFQYAGSYASVAAEAVRQGKSQSAAIEDANTSLTEFANNLLYASRELSGGFTTGLTNAVDLYNQAVNISQAARTNYSGELGGVLTAVAAIVGGLAPDLATSMTDAIYQAAVGGNSSSIVALRSLAGINASNTEFIQAIATNPQQVFSTLFTNLANMFGESNDAFMEKAEGYAELFGLNAEAFQRIDFAYLADAISKMTLDYTSLEDNLEMLSSGQTTLTQEQLKNREINEYLINEGLSYVLDNEAARAVQEHMWDEQLNRQLLEATYGVEITGAVKEAIVSIQNIVQRILDALNPFSLFKKVGSIFKSSSDAEDLNRDISQMLELGKVGQGSATERYRLTTTGKDLGLITDYVSLLGGTSNYSAGAGTLGSMNAALSGNLFDSLVDYYLTTADAQRSITGPTSKYSWNILSKSQSSAIGGLLAQTNPKLASVLGTSGGTAASTSSQSYMNSKLASMLTEDYMKKYVTEGGFSAWEASAKSMGISDLDKALTSSGYAKEDVQKFYEDIESKAAAEESARRWELEEGFYKDFDKFQDEDFVNFSSALTEQLTGMQDAIITELQLANTSLTNIDKLTTEINEKKLVNIYDKLKDYVTKFTQYFIDNIGYYGASGKKSTLYQAIQDVQAAEQKKSKDAISDPIEGLVQVLTEKTTDYTDPTLQTNVLLAEVVKKLDTLIQQNNTAANSHGLYDTYSGLALGGTTK